MSLRRSPHASAVVRAAVAAGMLLALGLGGCSAAPATSGSGTSSTPQIVVTTNILGDVVSEIVGDSAEVTTLMQPNADPHSFEISAQQAAAMDRADLLVSNGLGLEEGLQRHLDRVAHAGGAHFIAGDYVAVLEYAADDAAGTAATPTPDPHFWTDPQQMIAVAAALTSTLTQLPGLDATERDAVARRGRAFETTLTTLDGFVEGELASIPPARRALVTNHHVFGYFAERYDFRVLGTAVPGGTTLAAPSAADLSALVTTITEAGVPTIFAESSSPDRLMRVLADEAGLDVRVTALFTESLSEPGGGAASYVEMIRTNTERIVTGLTS